MSDTLKKYGYTAAHEVDNDVLACGTFQTYPKIDLSKIVFGRDIMFPADVQIAMHQYAELLNTPYRRMGIISAIVGRWGWGKKAAIRIHSWYVVTAWPDQYMQVTGKPILDREAFWKDAAEADSIEELYGKDY